MYIIRGKKKYKSNKRAQFWIKCIEQGYLRLLKITLSSISTGVRVGLQVAFTRDNTKIFRLLFIICDENRHNVQKSYLSMNCVEKSNSQSLQIIMFLRITIGECWVGLNFSAETIMCWNVSTLFGIRLNLTNLKFASLYSSIERRIIWIWLVLKSFNILELVLGYSHWASPNLLLH